MKAKLFAIFFRLAFVALAVYAYFGGRCPAQGCPACRITGK